MRRGPPLFAISGKCLPFRQDKFEARDTPKSSSGRSAVYIMKTITYF
jgi:hypothetical protein